MNRSVMDRVVSATGAIVGVVLLAAAALLFFANSYVHGQVSDQLKEQQITFPAAGSEAIASLPAADQKEISKYAGQPMETGAQAKAFADHYIKVHLREVADGQTYSQVSAKALANPDDQKLAGQVQTLFRGETLRGLLLNAYAFDTMATVALIAAWISVAAGVLLLLLAGFGLRHARTAAAAPAESPAEYAAT
jgi:spore germination protein GerM